VRATGVQATKFAVIGALGFVIDGGILTLLNSAFGIDLLRSRICSFSVAVTVTWFLNRNQTFTEQKNKRAASEWGRYAAVNSVGALLNMGIFFWLIHRFDWLRGVPLLPLAIAAMFALIFNFFASKHLVFQGQRT
jgi:putative flippase GtrA